MTTDQITLLTSLLERQDALIADVKQRLEATNQPVLLDYYLSVLSELQPACDELAEALARAIKEAAKS